MAAKRSDFLHPDTIRNGISADFGPFDFWPSFEFHHGQRVKPRVTVPDFIGGLRAVITRKGELLCVDQHGIWRRINPTYLEPDDKPSFVLPI